MNDQERVTEMEKLSTEALRKLQRNSSSRSQDFRLARRILNERASQDPRNNISIGVIPNPPNSPVPTIEIIDEELSIRENAEGTRSIIWRKS